MRQILAHGTIAGRVALGCAVAVGLGGLLVAGVGGASAPGFATTAPIAIAAGVATMAAFVVCRWLLARELQMLHQLAAAIDSVEVDGSTLYRNLPQRGPGAPKARRFVLPSASGDPVYRTPAGAAANGDSVCVDAVDTSASTTTGGAA